MGELLAFTATLFFTFQTLLLRWGLSKDEDNKQAVEEVQLITASMQLVFLLLGVFLADLFFDFSLAGEFANLNTYGFLLLILEGMLGPLSGFFLLTTAIGQIGASRATSLRASNSLFTALLAMVFLRETPGLLGFAGILVIFFGIVLVNYRSDQESISIMPETKLKGGLIAILAGLGFALSQTARGAALEQGATPTSAMIIGHLAAMFFICLYFWYKGKGLEHLRASFNIRIATAYSFAALFTILARYFLLFSFLHAPIWLAVAIRNTQPLFVLIFSWLLFKKAEAVNLKLVLGTLLIIGGVWVLLLA